MGIDPGERYSTRTEIIQWLQLVVLIGAVGAMFYSIGSKNKELDTLVNATRVLQETVARHELRIQAIEIRSEREK